MVGFIFHLHVRRLRNADAVQPLELGKKFHRMKTQYDYGLRLGFIAKVLTQTSSPRTIGDRRERFIVVCFLVIYPDQYVKLQILESHTEGNRKFVDEVALIKAIQDPKEATQELLRSKDGILVFHTSNEELQIELRTLRGLRGVVRFEN